MAFDKILDWPFVKIYDLYVAKVTKKQQPKEKVDALIMWLTGYDEGMFFDALKREVSLRAFFKDAPKLNPNRFLVKGVICGVRVETIEDSLIHTIRVCDKLIDECAKGRPLEKIMRE